jgi:hypothetical protein
VKARPRSVERSIADYLTLIFPGLTPFSRIPVLGRTGPDLTINELNLVIDIKSRIEVPKQYMAFLTQDDRFYVVPLNCLPTFPLPFDRTRYSSVLVARWWDHMHAWTQQHHPHGITALILHRPKMPYGKAMFIVAKSDYGRLYETWTTRSSRTVHQPA